LGGAWCHSRRRLAFAEAFEVATIMRYEVTADRAFYRALALLERRQAQSESESHSPSLTNPSLLEGSVGCSVAKDTILGSNSILAPPTRSLSPRHDRDVVDETRLPEPNRAQDAARTV